MHHIMGDLRLGRMAIRYSQFVPKLYNYCLSLSFQRDRMMPSRAFCSDESQGNPVILLAQHFDTFPFHHGVVGGKVATDRHGPHAHHGEDLVIIQASHVGYDAERQRFGVYRRQRTAHGEFGANCGHRSAVLDWSQQGYRHARNDVQLGTINGTPAVFIDNALLDPHRVVGLILQLDRFIDPARPDLCMTAFAAETMLRRKLRPIVEAVAFLAFVGGAFAVWAAVSPDTLPASAR